MEALATPLAFGGGKVLQHGEMILTITPDNCGPVEGSAEQGPVDEEDSCRLQEGAKRDTGMQMPHRSCLDLVREEALSRSNAAHNETIVTFCVPRASDQCFAWKRAVGSLTEQSDTSPRSSVLSQCETSAHSPMPCHSQTESSAASTRSKRIVRFCPSTPLVERLPTRRFNASGLRRSRTELRNRYYARLGIEPCLSVAEADPQKADPEKVDPQQAVTQDGFFRQFAARLSNGARAGVLVPSVSPTVSPPKITRRKATFRDASPSEASRAPQTAQAAAFDVDSLARSSDASMDFLAGWCV